MSCVPLSSPDDTAPRTGCVPTPAQGTRPRPGPIEDGDAGRFAGTITGVGDVTDERNDQADYLPAATVENPLTLERQLDALAMRARRSFQQRASRKSRWKAGNYVFGATAAVLAFASGATSLAQWFGSAGDDVAGILAFVSGLFAVVVGFFNFGRRFAESAAQKAGWFALAADASWLQTRWDGVDPAERCTLVRQLLDRELGLRNDEVEYSTPSDHPGLHVNPR
jgi:hypothetical protein